MIVLPFLSVVSVLFAYGGMNIGAVVLAYLLLLFIYGSVVLQNDLSDLNIDRANNRQDIPLVNGSLTVHEVRLFFILCLCAALASAILLGPYIFLWTIGYAFLGWVYSGKPRAKDRGYIAPVILGLCYGAMPWILGALIVKEFDGLLACLMVASFIFVAGIIGFKDFKDIAGDTLLGKRTLLVMHGARTLRRVAILCVSVAYACLSWYGQGTPVLSLLGLSLCILSLLALSRRELAESGRARARWVGGARALYYIYAFYWLIDLRS